MNVNGLRGNDIECLLKTHTAALLRGQLGSVSAACNTFPEKNCKSILSMVTSEIKNTMSTVLVYYTLFIVLKSLHNGHQKKIWICVAG